MSDSRDPFLQDQKRRERLMNEVYGVRLALFEAHEAQDGRAALDALARAYKLLEKLDDGQMLYVGGESVDTIPLKPAAHQMVAKFHGRCCDCQGSIKPGDIMYWVREERAGICVSCFGLPGVAREF